MPSSEWIISHTVDGRFKTRLNDNKAGLSKSIFETQFERGDAAKFNIMSNINSGAIISPNQTVAKINSNLINLKLTELKGDLAEAEATLNLFLTGEKDEIIREIQNELAYAKKQAEEEERIFERQKALFEKELIAEEDYEIFRGKKELAEINVQTLQARYDIVNTGAKKEQIDYLKTTIQSLKNEINTTEELSQKYIFKSPIGGIVRTVFSSDTILIVSDIKEYVLYIPIDLVLQKYIKLNETVNFNIPGNGLEYKAVITKLSHSTTLINGKYMILAFAEFNNDSNIIINGLAINCKINCGEISLTEYLKRFLHSLFI